MRVVDSKPPEEMSMGEYRKLERAKKAIGRETVAEMDGMGEEQLRKEIVSANGAMKEVQEELDANKDYVLARENVSALSQGKKDVDKRQKGKIHYALHRLAELGKA